MIMQVDIPDRLARMLENRADDVGRFLELGLRQAEPKVGPEFDGVFELLQTLSGLPSPQEVMDLRPSQALQDRMRTLLAKNRSDGLSSVEEDEWQLYERLEHLVGIAKAKAAGRPASCTNVESDSKC